MSGKRQPSAYNTYMSKKIAEVKANNPELDHKQAFKMAADSWKTSAENPKVEK
jgi:hypothetical protein